MTDYTDPIGAIALAIVLTGFGLSCALHSIAHEICKAIREGPTEEKKP